MNLIYRTWNKKIIAWATLITFSMQPVLAAAQAIADPNAPAQNRPSVESAQNGVPVVQIATPSAAGVSRNLYQQFNVGSEGLILNNSRVIANTQLAGHIIGNPNLTNGSARVILNEVTGTGASYLRGYTEVAGQRAEVIIANPNGIFANGAGFINTSRAVLTTGTPVFGGSGSLEAFRVTGGQIAIEGTGLDASQTDRVDLISRAVSVNAGVWAKDLNVVAGANNVNANTLETAKITGEGAQPVVAIDVSDLGGMYANKIKLVGTEQGVGVNSRGTIAASGGDLVLTNEGKIVLAGSTSAAGNIQINANDDVIHQGTAYAQGNVNVTTAGTLANTGVIAAAQNTAVSAKNVASTGTIGAGINSDGTVGNTGDLTINASEAITAKGQTIAGGNLTVTGASIDQSGATTYAGGTANLTAIAGDVNNTGGSLQANGALTITAAGTIRNDKDSNATAGQIQANQLTLSASTISNQGGKITQYGTDATILTAVNGIDNTGGKIATNGTSLSLKAKELTNNQGQIQHAGTGNLGIEVLNDLKNNGAAIVGNGTVNLKTQNIDNTSGSITGQRRMDVDAANITNIQGTIAGAGVVSITAQGAVSNQQGVIEASSGFDLSAQSLNNQSGKLNNIGSSDLTVTVSQDIQNQSGLIGSNGNVNVTAKSLGNTNGQVIAQNSLTLTSEQGIDNTQGVIASNKNLTLNSNNGILQNDRGTVQAGNNLTVQADTVSNTGGNLLANRDMQTTARTLSGSGKILAGQDITATIQGDFTNAVGGEVQANRNLTINASGVVVNQGAMTAVQGLNVNGAGITNETGASIKAVSSLNLTTAGDMTNQGTVYGKSDVNINATGTLTNAGVLASAQNTAISAQTVSSTGTIGAGINSDGSVSNSGDLAITATGAVVVTGKTIAGGNLGVTGVSIDQSGSATYAGGSANITATNGDIKHTGASMQVGSALTISAAGKVKNDKDASGKAGQITANSVNITANGISNKGGSILQTGTNATTLTVANSIDNTGGTIATNGSSLSLKANEITNSQGQIQHAGTENLNVETATNLKNDGGKIIGNGNVALKADAFDNIRGTVSAKKGLEIVANTVNNEQGVVVSAEALRLTAQGSVTNKQGVVEAGKGLELTAQSLNNQGGRITSLDQSGLQVTVDQSIGNQSGLIGGNGNVTIKASSIANNSGQVLTQGNLTLTTLQGIDNTQGTLSAGQNLTLKQKDANLTNNQGTVEAGNDLAVQAAVVYNTSGKFAANQNTNLTMQSLNGIGKIKAGQDIDLAIAGDFTNETGNEFKANRDFTLTAGGNVTNRGSLEAGQNLTVSGSSITNDATALMAANKSLTANAVGDFNNTGSVFGKDITVQANRITNANAIAVIGATGNINLYATSSLENKDDATIYSQGHINIAGSADKDGSGQFTTKTGNVLNQSASIEAEGDIVISANELTNKIRSYTVEERPVSETRYDYQNVFFTPYTGNLYFINSYSQNSAIRLTPGTEITLPTLWLIKEKVSEAIITPNSPVGKILAGRNMLLNVPYINNEQSQILAAGTLTKVPGAVVNNVAVGNQIIRNRTIVYADTMYFKWTIVTDSDTGFDYGRGPQFDFIYNIIEREKMYGIIPDGEYQVGEAYTDTITEQLTGGISAVFGGGQQVSIQGGSVNNVTIAPGSVVNEASQVNASGNSSSASTIQTQGSTGGTIGVNTAISLNTVSSGNLQSLLPSAQGSSVPVVRQTADSNITLPKNGMYAVHTEPTVRYLVETNPRFTSYKTFISSDYMLQQLNIDPAATLKRLGDGFYEQKLVREQITELTGRVYLSGYDSAEAQYKALLENGAIYAKAFNLKVGVALSAEQIAQLTSDIVWLVEKEVEGQKVLVPVVYMAQLSSRALLASGAVIAADNVNISGDNVNNAGTIKATQLVSITAGNVNNIGGIIDGGKDTKITASLDISNISGTIAGENVTLTAGRDIKSETFTFTTELPFLSRTSAGNVATINAGQNLTVEAIRDINITGTNIKTGTDLTLDAGRDLTIGSVQTQERMTIGSRYLKDNVTNVVSSLEAGNNINLTSKGDMTLKGVQASAGNELDLNSGRNVLISAIKDSTTSDITVGGNSNWTRTMTSDENVIGSNLSVKNNLKISTPGSITMEGSSITSEKGKVSLEGNKGVTVKEVTEKHESLVQTHKESSGFFSSKTTDTRDYSLINQVVGSTVSGDQVEIKTDRDLTVKGSNLVGTNDVNLNADNINIISAKENGASEHYRYEKTSGIFSGGGLGFTIGSKSEKTTLNEQTIGEVGSTIGSISGNVNVTADNKVSSSGTNFVSGKDINITGKDVTIDNTVNTYDSQYKYEFKQSGLTVSLGGGVLNTGLSVYNNIQRSSEVQDDRLQALYEYKAYKDLKDLNKALSGGLTRENLEKDVSINVNIGSTQITSEQTTHVETVNASNVTAGGNVTIKATENDVNLKGTNINAQDVTIEAKNNINIESAKNISQTDSKTSSSSWSVGASYGLSNNGAFGGFTGSYNSGSGKENENSVTNTESVIKATDTLTVKSGNDTNIIGSQVGGEKVVANIGGNLNIASTQDTNNYAANNQSSGIGFSTGSKGGVTGSYSKGNTDSTYNSVIDQAGIFAGKEGFDITVGKNTDLKGAVIASDATPDKNTLSTGTLTVLDIQNKAEYNSSSIGVNVGFGPGTEKKDQGITPNIGVPASDSADSTTKSAVSPGTIEVRSNPTADLSGLSRDPAGAVNTLGRIFDKKTVQERQELATVFGEVAFEEVHKLSVKNGWVEGGPEKTALHALVGGLMAQLGGGSFAAGATGAGINELVQTELAKIKDPALHQWASALVGAAASSAVGGNAQTGASTAVSGTRNNFLVAVPVVIDGVAVLAAATVLATPEGKKLVDATGKVIGTWVADTSSWVSNTYQQYIVSSTYVDAINNHLPTDKHTVREGRNLPQVGEPNSSADLLNPDGSVKQRRYYDKDGNADWDIDYNHTNDGTHKFPHKHKWGEDGRGEPE